MFIYEISHAVKHFLLVCYCFQVTQYFILTNSDKDIYIFLFSNPFLFCVEVRKRLGFS